MAGKVDPTYGSFDAGSVNGTKTASPFPDSSYFSASSIASVGSVIGLGFFRCLSFIFVQGFYLVSRFAGKQTEIKYQPSTFPQKTYDLTRYDDIVECFEQDPVQGANKLLTLLEESPNVFKAIVSSSLQKSGKWTRRDIISKIEDVYYALLSPPEVLYHAFRVVMADISDKEALWLKGNDKSWDPTGKDIQVITSRRLQSEYEKIREAGYQIWKKCFSFIKIMADDVEKHLKLLNKEQYVGDGQVDIKLGDFLERLHHLVGFGVLTAREERFDPLMTAVLNVIGYLNNGSEVDLGQFPEFKKLVNRVHRLLQKKECQQTLFELVQLIISNQSPSPKKRSSSPFPRENH